MATAVKRLLVGRALRNSQAIHERLTKKTALAVFSSDALSSTAYATEEILLVLAVAAAATSGTSPNGCAALTGIEAISNGVQAFKKPEAKNAATTLIWMALLLTTMFLGTSVMAREFQRHHHRGPPRIHPRPVVATLPPQPELVVIERFAALQERRNRHQRPLPSRTLAMLVEAL